MSTGPRGLQNPAMTGEAGTAPVAADEIESACVLGEIRTHLERAEGLLLRPSASSAPQLIGELEECCRLLAGAEAAWRQQSGRGAGSARERLTAAEEWRLSLRRLERLTAGASSFCQGWAEACGLAGGYTATGLGDVPPGGALRVDRTG